MKNSRIMLIVTAVMVFACAFSLSPTGASAASKKCSKTGCQCTAIDGGQYCSNHTCTASGCKKMRYSDSTTYCYSHRCEYKGCSSKREDGSSFCKSHKAAGEKAYAEMWQKNQKKSSSGKGTAGKSSSSSASSKKSSTSKSYTQKKYDPYNVYSYKSAQDFADDKYEEFYDYEDDYEDEDEAYDAAEDYWREHHKK